MYLAESSFSCSTQNFIVAHGCSSWGTWAPKSSTSVDVVRRLSCSTARGILISPTRNRTCILCIAMWILNHWTVREVPVKFLLTDLCLTYILDCWAPSMTVAPQGYPGGDWTQPCSLCPHWFLPGLLHSFPNLFEKTLMLGKIEGRRRRGRQRTRWLDDITNSMDMSLSRTRLSK